MSCRLHLIDATSQLYRAYFAIRGLKTRAGLPTGGVYGFATMLRKLLADEDPRYVVAAFDLGRRVFRHDQFPDYKANRQPTPDDLKVQLPWAKRVCAALGVPVVELEGYEADDLIATLAKQALAQGHEVVVVAADKDLYQLVGDGLVVLNPTKGERLDAAGVATSFGVEPERVRDVLGLMGDSIDNIPGVPGVGQKTALSAVNTYGPLESVIERAGRFAAAADARDELLAALDALAGAEPSGPERVRSAREALLAAVPRLVEVEADPDQRARWAGAAAQVQAVEAPGLGGRAAIKKWAAAKRELKDLDRGSAKRIWYAIRDHAEQARLSLQLATLNAEAPVALDLARLARFDPDAHEAAALFRELEFRDFLKGAAPAPSVAPADGPAAVQSEVVLTVEQLAALVESCSSAERIALSVETGAGGPLHAPLAGIAVAYTTGRGAYLPLGHVGLAAPRQLALESVRAALGPLLADPDRLRVAHDTKAAAHVLRRHGMPVGSWALDTMVGAFLLDASRERFTLDAVARELGGRDVAPAAPLHAREADPSGFAPEAAARAAAVLGLAETIENGLHARGLTELYRTIDGPVLPVLERMERHGIRIEIGTLASMALVMQQALGRARGEIHTLAGQEFNIDSPKQLREVLFGTLGLRARHRTAKGKEPSTDARALEELADEHAVAAKILEYRELAKLKGTYVDALPRLVDPATGRVHTTYHPTGAATGRLSSSDPNLQNIPARTAAGRAIRAAFVPEDGWMFLASDYSQIELRVLAHLTGDPGLVAAFRAGEDVHRHTAARVFGVLPELVTEPMRARAKVVNFGVLYGMSETRLAREQRIARAEAHQFIVTYFERFARVREYIERVRTAAQQDGEVRTLFGRVRRFPQLGERGNRAIREQALRAAVNTTVQGTAADLMKLAMLAVDRELAERGCAARILLQVHDELLLEVPQAEVEQVVPLVRRAMEGVFPLDVPLVADLKLGRSWQEVT